MNKRVILIAVIVCAVVVMGWASLSLYQDAEPSRIANQQAEASNQKSPLDGDATREQSSPQNKGAMAGNGGASQGSGTSETPSPQGERIYCTPESHEVQECEINDHPVCGWYDTTQISCDSGPCVRSTFPNECEACMSQSILYWTEGECPIHE